MKSKTYTVFARRYRPMSFDEVVGQEHVARTLRNAIVEGRVGHAYVFAGPRGVGKTSTARLFARALNCAQGPTPTPCGTCEICVAVHEGSDADIVEMDAASNRGVDDARALREGVRYAPLRARSKVYIIDEAHMLTREAFNTLLKTLEEPPPHVKFIFATTEIHKLPETITSRCQRFDFRRITTADIARRLRQIIEREGLPVADAVLDSVARAGRGSMRDAESLLDQLVAYTSEDVTPEDVAALLGAAADEELGGLVEAVKSGEVDRVFVCLDRIFGGGIDPAAFVDQLLDHYRSLLAIRACGATSPVVDLPDGVRGACEKQVEGMTTESILYTMQILLDARRRLREGANARLVLEVALVKAARAADLVSLADLVRTSPQPSDAPSPRPLSPPAPAPSSPAPDEPESNWASVVAEVKAQSVLAGTLLGEGKITRREMEAIEFTLPSKFTKFHVEQLESPKNRAVIEGAIHKVFGRRHTFSCKLERSGENPAPRKAPDLSSDPTVKKVLEAFGGRIVGIE